MTLNNSSDLAGLDCRHVVAGFRQMLPIAAFVMVFGAAFGLAAMQIDLNSVWVVLMSAFVFAGASQFAALDLWGSQVPLFTLAVTVFAINARHLLMGASLYPWLVKLPSAQRYGVMVLASDANWAVSMQSFARGQSGFGVLLGGGFALWLFWVAGTILGVYFGGAIQDPRQYGFDMVMGCFLLAMAIGGQKNVRIVVIWSVAAASSLLAYKYLQNNTHVIIGALSGGVLGAIWMERVNEY